MNLWEIFLRPNSVEDALIGLASAAGPACLIAGGTDLLLDLKQGNHAPVHTLVDLTSIPEMAALEVHTDSLFIGAAVPFSKIVTSDIVKVHAQALNEAAQLVAGPQVRNTASLGGNVVHALPAADGTIALMVLQAQAEIADLRGRRKIALTDLFLGPGKSAIKAGEEILVGFHLPLSKDHQASAFRRIMRAQGIALPILNVAVWLERDQEVITDIRLAVGPGGPKPWRAENAESKLRGQLYKNESIAEGLSALLEQVGFRTSAYRASADYRAHLAGGLFEECLDTAWKRAGLDQ